MALIPVHTAPAVDYCRWLEAGDILFFPRSPIAIPEDDLAFLISNRQSDSGLHKNIAYKPGENGQGGVISGLDRRSDPAAQERLRSIMEKYSREVETFLEEFLAPYKKQWRLDYASFRPQEERGRDLPLRRRNDLLHTDAFPTRPTHGARILRFFNNIHPSRTRDWTVSDPFAAFIRQYAPREIPLPHARNSAVSALGSLARSAGMRKLIPSLQRTPYDAFMMDLHNFLKENAGFQQSCAKYPLQFPPGSSWMVYTDMVPHAVLAGQYALEQTFFVDRQAMVSPETSPLHVLETMTGERLVE